MMNHLLRFKQSFKDFATPKMLKLALWPLGATLVILYILFFIGADMTLSALADVTLKVNEYELKSEQGEISSEVLDGTYTGSAIIDFLLKHSITSWLVGFLIYTVGGFAVLGVSVYIAIIVVGFMTPLILKELQRRHYPEIELEGFGTLLGSIGVLIKSIGVMVLLLILLMPLYFIPLVNLIAIHIPFFYLFHKLLSFDVGSTLCRKEEYLYLKSVRKNSLRTHSLLLYGISLIPFTALLGAVFFVIYLGHLYFSEVRALRNEVFKQEKLEA